jgi:hypothetical protein
MKCYVQFALVVVSLLYLAWGLCFVAAPEVALKMLTTGPANPTLFALLGASLLGFASVFMITANDPEAGLVQASATSLAFIGFTAFYQMVVAKGLPMTAPVVISLAINLGAAIFLFLALSEDVRAVGEKSASPKRRTASARRRR